MSSAVEWRVRERNYEQELAELRKSAAAVEVTEHPLGPKAKATSKRSPEPQQKKAPAPQFDDPLSLAAAEAATSDPLSAASFDPLSSALKEIDRSTSEEVKKSGSSRKAFALVSKRFVPWSTRRTHILQKYRSTGQVAFASLLSAEDAKAIQESDSAEDKLQARVAELQDKESAESTVDLQKLSESEYVEHMEKLNRNMEAAWNNSERVRALKMTIALSKLLAETSVPQFYPSMYVLITDILSNFGSLVFARIRGKGMASKEAEMKEDHEIIPEDVSVDARETCRNWFFKIASIRELVPRIYMELSILECYRFLTHGEYPTILKRLSLMIRGIGDPLVASYARAYFAHKLQYVAPECQEALEDSISDIFVSVPLLSSSLMTARAGGPAQWFDVLRPALSYAFQIAAESATEHGGQKEAEATLKGLLSTYRKKGGRNSAILLPIMEAFDEDSVSNLASAIAILIKESSDVMGSKADLYVSLGEAVRDAPPTEDLRLPLLNEVWRVVTRFPKDQIHGYLRIAAVWVDFVLRSFSGREVKVLLRDILKHCKDIPHEDIASEVLAICNCIVQNATSFSALMENDSFAQLLDIAGGSNDASVATGEGRVKARTSLARDLLELFVQEHSNGQLESDLVVIHAAFDLARALHDSITTLTFEDERKQITYLIAKFVRSVDFGNDLEQHLNFLVDCRQAFVNLDGVKDTLIMSVCSLVMRTFKIVNGHHTRRTGAFVKACLAYNHITIPSIEDRMLRLQLFLLSGEISLANGMLSQADTFYKTIILLLPDLPLLEDPPSEEEVVLFLRQFISSLSLVPGHPEHGPFYILTGLMNVIQDYPWKEGSASRMVVSVALLQYFAVVSQPKLLWDIPGLDGNDVLFPMTEELREKVSSVCVNLLEDIMKYLDTHDDVHHSLETVEALLTATELTPKGAALVLELLGRVAQTVGSTSSTGKHSALLGHRTVNVASQMSYAASPAERFRNVVVHIKKLGSKEGELFAELANKLVAKGH